MILTHRLKNTDAQNEKKFEYQLTFLQKLHSTLREMTPAPTPR
jgi:hypothetical protein